MLYRENDDSLDVGTPRKLEKAMGRETAIMIGKNIDSDMIWAANLRAEAEG